MPESREAVNILHTRSIHECPVCAVTPEDFGGSFPTPYNRKKYDHDVAWCKQEYDPAYTPPYTYEQLISGRAFG